MTATITTQTLDAQVLASFIARVTKGHSGETTQRSIRVATTLYAFLNKMNTSNEKNQAIIRDFMHSTECVSDWKGCLDITTNNNANEVQLGHTHLATSMLEPFWAELWNEYNVSVNNVEIN